MRRVPALIAQPQDTSGNGDTRFISYMCPLCLPSPVVRAAQLIHDASLHLIEVISSKLI